MTVIQNKKYSLEYLYTDGVGGGREERTGRLPGAALPVKTEHAATRPPRRQMLSEPKKRCQLREIRTV